MNKKTKTQEQIRTEYLAKYYKALEIWGKNWAKS